MQACRSFPSTRRLTGDTGAAMVEATFVTPLILFLILGLMEGAFLMLDYLTVGNAVRTGLRTAAVEGKDPMADYNVVRAVLRGTVALRSGQITRIVVYKGTANLTSSVPADCATAPYGITGACNVYGPSSFGASADSWEWRCDTTSLDRYWCPKDRKTGVVAPEGPPDWVGVYVVVRHDFFTKFFGSSKTLSGDAVSLAERNLRL